MKPEEYYARKQTEIQRELRSIKKKRNSITLGKIGLFVGSCIGLYFLRQQPLGKYWLRSAVVSFYLLFYLSGKIK